MSDADPATLAGKFFYLDFKKQEATNSIAYTGMHYVTLKASNQTMDLWVTT
jgi:hypothetical protein